VKTFHVVSVILGCVLLFFLIYQIGLSVLWKQLGMLGWGLIPLVLIEGVADAFHTYGLRHCLSDTLKLRPFFELFCIRMAGASINYLTPTAGLGGEVTKGVLLAKNRGGSDAATGVILDKISYALSQLAFVLAGSVVALWFLDLPASVWVALFFSTTLLAASVIVFLLIQKHGKLGVVIRWLAARRGAGKYLSGIANQITEIDIKLNLFYTTRPTDLLLSILWHVLGVACGIVQTFYFLFLLTDNPSLSMAAAITFFGVWFNLLGFAIPMDIGVLEATRIISFRIVGLYSALGLAYGIMLRIEQLFWAGMGLLFYAVLVLRFKQQAAPARQAQSANSKAEA
jgi:hypothetical protein